MFDFPFGPVGFPTATSGDFARDAFILARDLDKFSDEIRSFKIPLRESVRQVIIPSILQNYEVDGRPPWESLADDTVRIRGSEGPILNRSGKMKKMTTKLSVWSITQTQAVMSGVDRQVKYAKYHQSGTSRMPQRLIAHLQEEDMNKIVEIFSDWIGTQAVTLGRYR